MALEVFMSGCARPPQDRALEEFCGCPGELGPADVDLTFHVDGTFESTATDQLCAMDGTWSVADDDSLLTAEAVCDGVTVTFESIGPRPEGLSGRITTSDRRSANFEADYRPATLDRPLTEEELSFVGESTQRPCGPRGCDDVTSEFRADGTFFAQGDVSNSFFAAPLRGHWEITESGLLTAIGRSSGFTIRTWQPAYPEGDVEGNWSSNNGFGTAFEGTGTVIGGELGAETDG